MEKETFIRFLKDQMKKKYSAELILKHLKNGWEELIQEEKNRSYLPKSLPKGRYVHMIK
jgi:hypothetical protein